MKYYKSAKEPELFHYTNVAGEKLWMYRHKYYDGTGKRREKKKSGFTTEKTALKALLEVKAQTLRGDIKQFDYEKLTVGQWLDMWYEMNSKKWKISTQISREHIIDKHLKPLIGHFKLQKLDKLTYKKYFLNVVEGKFKPGTIQLWHKIFKIAINAAIEEEILLRNRFNRMALPVAEYEEGTRNYFNSDELVTLLHDVKKNENITNYSLFLTLGYTGIRKGEAMGLQWKNVDFKKKTITIERTRDDKSTRSPKTKNSYRTIFVDDALIQQLEVYQKWCKKMLLTFGKTLKEDSFIFVLEDTSPIYSRLANNVLDRSIKRTKLNKITVHGLRHTHATILLNQGQNVKVIAERLGDNTDMIYKIYGHIMKDLEVESVAVFGQSLKTSGANFGANS